MTVAGTSPTVPPTSSPRNRALPTVTRVVSSASRESDDDADGFGEVPSLRAWVIHLFELLVIRDQNLGALMWMYWPLPGNQCYHHELPT